MPILEWEENFNLGVPQFDAHHQHLIELLNRAYDNFVNDASVAGLAVVLDEFFSYALHHFRAEEQFMEETNYTGYLEHLELHKSFAAQVAVMQRDLKMVWGNLPLEMLSFLRNWLTYEILTADAEYVRVNSGIQWKQCA